MVEKPFRFGAALENSWFLPLFQPVLVALLLAPVLRITAVLKSLLHSLGIVAEFVAILTSFAIQRIRLSIDRWSTRGKVMINGKNRFAEPVMIFSSSALSTKMGLRGA